MRKVILVIALVITLLLGIAGILAILLGFFQGFRYVLDYKILSQYGKGHVWGSVLFFVIGLAVAYLGFRAFKKLRAIISLHKDS